MRIGIIQMSDLHISSGEDNIVKNVENIARSCKAIINTCQKVAVVVTGDIIDRGKVGNYTLAENFFSGLQSALEKEAKLDEYTHVFVPGNHDIDFSINSEIRALVVEKLQKRDSVEEESFIQECLKPQKPFWDFVSRMYATPVSPCVSYSIKLEVNDNCNLIFHCYNTALISTVDEQPGALIVPENHFLYDSGMEEHKKDVVISVFHHNTGWLSTKTANNNKKTFEKHIEQTSHVLMCGHEHQREEKIISDLDNKDKILYLEGNSMQQGAEQSFSVLALSDEDENLTITPFEVIINKDGTSTLNEKTCQMIGAKKHAFSFTDAYNDYLSHLEAPIVHPVKKNLTLDDIFVYPDLEPLSSLDNRRMYTYMDASSLLKKCTEGQTVFIEGDAQSGKTSLLKMLVRQCYQEGIYPLFIKGEDFKVKNLNGVLRQAYKKQYVADKASYEQFMQMDRAKRCVFIDNVEKSRLNREGINECFKNVFENYAYIIATSGTDNSIGSLLQKSRKDNKVVRYLIHQLGHLKRNQLVERWLLLGADRYMVDYNLLLDRAKLIMERFTNILGKQLLPSNPIFLLIMLQEMNETLETYDVAPTSYANLYQGLLMSALHKQDVPQSDFDGVIQFLSSMAYSLFKNGKQSFMYDYQIDGELGYVQYYETYSSKYNTRYGKEKLLDILVRARLVVEKESGIYSFAYKYIYFYLVAKHIVSLQQKEKNAEIKKLCEELYKEENGNILIFMAYLDRDLSLIEEIKFASWLPFENITPVTLEQNDNLYQQLADFVQEVKDDVLRTDVDYKQVQEKALKRQDEVDRAKIEGKTYVPTDEDFEKDKNLRESNDMLKANKIIGQIIKNQRDMLPKEEISNLLADAYLASFRVLSYFAEMLGKDKQLIVDDILKHVKNATTIDRQILTDKINKLIQMMLLRVCYSVFANLAASVGTAGIGDIFDKVSKEKIKSPAADVITFTIKSYYEPLKERDLEEMMAKYKNNPVVLDIVRARVRSYVYSHDIGFSRIQRLGDISGLTLLNNTGRALSKMNK